MVKIGLSGLKIKNIKAGTLYGYNIGVRDHYDYTDAMFNDSLFSRYMLRNGMTIYRGESTRDIICLDFDFGSRSFEEEMLHIEKLILKNPLNKRFLEIREKVIADKDKYRKMSKDQIRELFYKDGVDVTYYNKGGSKQVIHYKMLYRNSSKAKLGLVMFIRALLWRKAIDWLTIGLYRKMPYRKAKIVEMSAYAPLTTSTIVDTMHIPVEDILFLRDQDSFFEVIANVVTAQDYADKDGLVKKKCVVNKEKCKVKNTLWDGMALVESAAIPAKKEVNGMMLLRNHLFKACAFRTNIQLFFKDWCARNNKDYYSYEVEDMFGIKHRVCDIKMITTDNAIKWKKFVDLMGGTLPAAFEYWKRYINNDGSVWGIVKTDHPSKLGNVQLMSYQMLNTLPCDKQTVERVARYSMDYVETLKDDNEEFIKFLRKHSNAINHYEMLADLYEWNNDFSYSTYFRAEKRAIINAYVNRLRCGKITVEADNLTTCGNPYALLLYAVGDDWTGDTTMTAEDGVILCYTTMFDDGECLCGFRSPHNSPNNCVYLKNVYSHEMKRYFLFSNNIIAVNCIGTDILSRCNGMDFDSDFLFVTNNPELVECSRVCYEQFPTIVNALNESGITYDNKKEQYALMDSKFAKSRRGIGESSNLAMLAISYYWTYLQSGEHEDQLQDLYDNFVILSVLAQLIIDSCKREYEVDALSEIDRIKKMSCMQVLDSDGNKKDFPMFMKYTRSVPVTKNGKELEFDEIQHNRDKIKSRINDSLICPMNWLLESLNMIQGAPRTATIPTSDFFILLRGLPNYNHVTKVIELALEFDQYVKHNYNKLDSDEHVDEFISGCEDFFEKARKMNIRNKCTFNYLIAAALDLDCMSSKDRKLHGKKYSRKILNMLYKSDKLMFLSNFVKN